MSSAKRVTAFELDGAFVGDTDAYPFTFGGFPGRWQIGRPMLPAALGLTVTRMRELIAEYRLPLVEVQVAEKDAYTEFEADPSRIESGPQVPEPVQRQQQMLEINGQLIPGPTQPPPHPELQPFAAEQIARDTARLYPDDDPAEIVADLEVEEGSAAEHAAADAAGVEEGGS